MIPADNPPPSNYPLRRNLPSANEDIDIRRYLGLFLSNWYWFATTLFIAGILAYGINTYSEKVYTISASLLIGNDQSTSSKTGLEKVVPGGDIFGSQQNLQNEIGILKSFSLNKRVMQELPEFHVTVVEIGRRGIAQRRHYKSEPFVVVYDSLKNQVPGVQIKIRIKSEKSYTIAINGYDLNNKELSFGERFNEAGFDFRIMLRDPKHFTYDPNFLNRFTFWFNQTEELANIYRGKLMIEPATEEATLVTLIVSGVSQLQESEYLNKLMEVYIRRGLEIKNQAADNTIEFIDDQLGLIADSLAYVENKLEKFKLSNKLTSLSSEGSSIKNKLDSYAQEKISAILQKQYYIYLADYIKTRNESGEIVSPSIMGVTDQLLIGLIVELTTLQKQKKQLNYNFATDQPEVSFIDSKIEDGRSALNENLKNCIINVDRLIKDIDSRISLVENDLNKLPGTERKLINIQRKYDLNNTVFTYMLEKRSEAGIAKASNTEVSSTIDKAEPFNSSRIRPNVNRNYLIALLLGLLVPGLYIFLTDRLHNKIIDKKDIERGTQVPIIGYVSHNSSNNEIPVISKPGSSLAESFRSVRTNLKYYLNGENKALISVTSTISGEGKTFISLNLAAVIAMLGRKTLLIGMDLRKPRLDKILNPEDNLGLSNFLIGESGYNEIIHATEVENLSYVPSGPVPPNPSELIETEKMKQFMVKVKKDFDFIVLDTPPVGIVSDALLLSQFADINIFVIRQRFSFKNTLELIQNIFRKKELKNLTIVVNDIYISGYYGYGLRYGYGFYEGYGYNYGYGQYGSYGRGDYHKYYTED